MRVATAIRKSSRSRSTISSTRIRPTSPLTGGSVDENAAAGTTVATLSAVDADAGDSHTYAITSDPSGFFEIVGNEVRVASGAANIDFETDADPRHHGRGDRCRWQHLQSEVITLTVNDLFDEDPDRYHADRRFG